MDTTDIDLIEGSFAALAPTADDLVRDFYDRLFTDYPSVRPLFKENVGPQRLMLKKALILAVENLRKPDVLMPTLRSLGARHAGYGTEPDHYAAVKNTLLKSMAEFGNETWTEDVAGAWARALDVIATTMLEGATQAQA